MTTTYDQNSDLSEVFVGHRIVKVEMNPEGHPPVGWDEGDWSGVLEPIGRLTLDDGTQVYVAGNDGGCACSAGCYQLQRLAKVDNIITSVKVIDESTGDDGRYDEETGEYTAPPPGRYSIFVITAADQLNVAEFEGTDGNGYYGTGFHVMVVPVSQTAPAS